MDTLAVRLTVPPVGSVGDFHSLVRAPCRAHKTERPVLDRPLKVGGGIQPRLVTVLTPATTFTVGEDFIQNSRAVNSTSVLI